MVFVTCKWCLSLFFLSLLLSLYMDGRKNKSEATQESAEHMNTETNKEEKGN